jgi:hypothetical protein
MGLLHEDHEVAQWFLGQCPPLAGVERDEGLRRTELGRRRRPDEGIDLRIEIRCGVRDGDRGAEIAESVGEVVAELIGANDADRA